VGERDGLPDLVPPEFVIELLPIFFVEGLLRLPISGSAQEDEVRNRSAGSKGSPRAFKVSKITCASSPVSRSITTT
jgi:hypothetical protein